MRTAWLRTADSAAMPSLRIVSTTSDASDCRRRWPRSARPRPSSGSGNSRTNIALLSSKKRSWRQRWSEEGWCSFEKTSNFKRFATRAKRSVTWNRNCGQRTWPRSARSKLMRRSESRRTTNTCRRSWTSKSTPTESEHRKRKRRSAGRRSRTTWPREPCSIVKSPNSRRRSNAPSKNSSERRRWSTTSSRRSRRKHTRRSS
mmetsp:Transcript_40689/g.95069  ORF Transcript_40689/g.95069 Transcript_40689/m.95069 type:complete len:202 (-) Transcript_40689:845-1450(-)